MEGRYVISSVAYKRAYAGQLNSFTRIHLRALLVLHDRSNFLAQATSVAGHVCDFVARVNMRRSHTDVG
jgi:hypothetical protein